MSVREQALAEAYRRGIMKPEQKAAYEEALRRGLVSVAPRRTMVQRFRDNVRDGFNRSGLGHGQRSMDPEADGTTLGDLGRQFFWGAEILEGGLVDRVLDATAGEQRGWLRSVNDQTRRDAPQIARERARRERYEALARVDPIRNVGDFAAFLAGQVVGGGVSPESWVGGAASRGLPLAQRLATTAGKQALIAGGTDVALQAADIGSGVQDEYSLMQTAGAGLLGGVLGVAGEEAARPLSNMVRRAFTDPVGPRPNVTAPEAAPVGPDFDIVQPVERRTPIRDLLNRAREGEIPQIVGDTMARAYTAVVSDQHPLIRAVEDMRSQTEALTGAPVDLLPSQDPRKLARGRMDWAAVGHADLLHGVHGYRETAPSTPALADAISAVAVRGRRAGEDAAEALQRFNKYLVARRSTLEWDRHARGELDAPPISRSKVETDAFIAHVEGTDPHFREAAEAVNAYAGGLLKKARDAGLVDQATYDTAVAARDFYVPLQRVMDDGPKGMGQKLGGSVVKAFGGSRRDVVDPLSVLVERTYRLNQRIRQNELNLSLIGLAERLEKAQADAGLSEAGNGWLRKVETPAQPVKVSRAELKAQANRNAPDDMLDELFDEDGVEAWRAGQINDAGRPVLHAWRGGKREAFELIDAEWGKDVFEAMEGLPRGAQDTFLKVAAAPTALLSQTITRDPGFLFANFIRDQLSAWILTDVGFKPGEGLAGMADELAQSDVTRLYSLSGGISGGAATAMLGDTLHRTDTLALTRGGVKAKYFSSLGGLLATSEISETGTRLRLFKRAFERAKAEGFSETDALIESSFAARDYIDFSRAGSKMGYTRRLVTFLNASVQGLDKGLRVLGADGAMTRVPLKDALRPLVGMKVEPGQMRAEDAAAFKLAGKAWVKIAAIATIGATLTALHRDDPEYQQANERMRATHWIVPWGENLVRIPKPFELAFLSNIVERSIEGMGGDDRAWGRLLRGLGEIFTPPTDIPLVAVTTGLASNTNHATGRPIVPEHLQNQPPELQYQYWNSQFSRRLGDAINVSPAKIDYFIQSFAGPWGGYALNAMDAADPDRPSGSWVDLPVVRRFVSPAARGAQDKRDFYDRAGAQTSELQRALNGVREYQKRGQQEAAQETLRELDEPGRLFVLSQMGEMATRRLNPLERGRVFAQEASRMIGELNGAQPKDDGSPLPTLTRRERQSLEDAIERVAVAELRNAMIATRQRGFENRKMLDRASLWEDLRDISPVVADELERRVAAGRDRAYDYDTLIELWPQVEQRLRAEGSAAYLDDLAGTAEGRTHRWGEKVEADDELPEVLRF